jgi:hypothetical protein
MKSFQIVRHLGFQLFTGRKEEKHSLALLKKMSKLLGILSSNVEIGLEAKEE